MSAEEGAGVEVQPLQLQMETPSPLPRPEPPPPPPQVMNDQESDMTDNDEDEDEDEWTSEEEGDDEEEEEEDDEEDVEEEEEIDEVEVERLRAKEERQRRREERPDPQNVDGAISIDVLRTLSNEMLIELIHHSRKDVERLKTENFLFERTIERLEEPEKILEEMFALKNKKDADSSAQNPTGPMICPSESEEEEPQDENVEPDYAPIVPVDEITVETDSFFDNMSDNSKEAALNYFKNIGIIAPLNYDVMRHKYGTYVKGAVEDPDFTTQTGVGVAKPTRLKSSVFAIGMALLEEKNKKTTVSETAKQVIRMFSHWIGSGNDEELAEIEYPDFNESDAKELRVEDKLKFALQAEEEFRKIFYQHETRRLKDEGAVEVNIDAHQRSVGLLVDLCKDFEIITNDPKHPMSVKTMTDIILRLRRKMRNQISGEETKTRMAIRNIMAIRRRVAHQLRCAKRAGTTVSEIDFEHLNAENEIFKNEMDEMNLYLKYLKQYSSNFFHIMTEDGDEIKGLKTEEKKIAEKIEKKRLMFKTFEKTYQKYKNLIVKTKARLIELKRKLVEFHAPKPIEYIHLKATQFETEAEVIALERRLKDLELKIVTVRSNFAKLCKEFPKGDETEMENEEWLIQVKDEVASNNLMELLDQDSDEESPDLPPSMRMPKSKVQLRESSSADTSRLSTASGMASATSDSDRRDRGHFPLRKSKSKKKARIQSQSQQGQGQGKGQGGFGGVRRASRMKTAQTILLTPTKAKIPHKHAVVYDTDFEFQF